jgi:glycosyltransferase involved in cell wall biosynthesis
MKKVVIIIPSLGRHKKLERLLASIKENAGYEDYGVLVVHDGEPVQNINYHGAEAICNAHRLGLPRALRMGVLRTDSEHVMFLGNDCVCKPNFLKEAMLKMDEIGGDGLVGLNDCFYKGTLATHWLASRKLLPMLGGDFFCTLYHHTQVDVELTSRCKKIGKYIWAKDAIVYHDHPAQFGSQEKDNDEGYAIAYNPVTGAEDRKLIESRSKEFDFEIISDAITHPGSYPQIKPCVDLRKKIGYGRGLKVLNVGAGSCESDLMKQMVFMEFKQLDHIDIHQPYLDHAKQLAWCSESVNFISRDIRDESFEGYDIIMIFDVLEHLAKEESLAIIEKIKKTKSKLVIFIPLEKEFRPNTFGAKSQDHLSLWTENDFKELGFETELLPYFHGTEGDALWAIREML